MNSSIPPNPGKESTVLTREALEVALSFRESRIPGTPGALGEYLREQALPSFCAPSEAERQKSWLALHQALTTRQALRRRRTSVWASAALLCLIIGMAWRGASGPLPVSDAGLGTVIGNDQTLSALIDLSHQLEQEWQAQQQRPRTVSGAELERQLQLSHLIASLDAQLGHPQQDQNRQQRLWQQRVVLMNELVASRSGQDAWPQTVAL